MPSTDAAFAGSIAAPYDRCLGPMLFERYAEDLAGRAAALRPSGGPETAAVADELRTLGSSDQLDLAMSALGILAR